MKKSYNFSKYLLITLVLLLSGCFEERNQHWELEYLEWSPPDKSTNALSLDLNLEAEQTDTQIMHLQMQYAASHKSVDITGTFTIDEVNSSAEEGKHFDILNESRTVTIPAGESFSNDIQIEVKADAFDKGEEHNIVLLITNEGDAAPMENYKEFNIVIRKETGFLSVIRFTLDEPGFLAGENIVDLSTGDVYTKNEANDNVDIQSRIDLGMWNSSSTEYTIILPTDADRLGGWGSGRTIRDDWENKNDGTIFKLPSDPENQELFDNILLEEDIIEAFDKAEQTLADFALDADDYGPGKHLQYVSTSELIFFYSSDRDFHAIMLVDEATTGSDGYAYFSMKNTVGDND